MSHGFCDLGIQGLFSWIVLAQSWSQEVGRDCKSQGLTGAGSSASKMAHLLICWLVTSVPHQLYFTLGCLCIFTA